MYRNFIFLAFLTFLFAGGAKAQDHWLIMLNGQRIFECPSTCSENGLNLMMLKANKSLQKTDEVTIVYAKPTVTPKISKIITVTDSLDKKFQTFSVYDEDGTHAVTLKAKDFMALHGVVIWYSEKKLVNGKEVVSKKVPLIYFQ